ncbi:hypothetical protein [Pseudomonas faucium]|uniref:hypothetical protein n=1 Tax=Pseudomonas faucium TaxID=2740518 RepID=UPI001F24365C|nr:hypothetical protein [Pseudomonas faucium]
MDSHQTIDVIQRALTERKDLGDKSVTIDSLEGFLEALKHTGQLQSPEQYLQSEEHTHQWGVEMVRSGIEAGSQALKTCLLISGGSAAALLAFAGSAWSALKPEGIEALSKTMMYLGIAILLTGLATAFTYLSQYFFAERKSWHERAGDCCQWTACGLVLGAYGLVFTAYLQASDMLTMFNVVKYFPIP